MGTNVPTWPFEIDPAKNYLVVVDVWTPGTPTGQCAITYIGTHQANRTGAQIIAWIDNGFECTYTTLISPPLAGFCDRIKSVTEI